MQKKYKKNILKKSNCYLNKNINQEKGITVITLVITIIVMLILTTVATKMIMNNNGTIEYAKNINYDNENSIEEKISTIENIQQIIQNRSIINGIKVSELPQNAVAIYNTQYYTSAQSAINEVGNNGENVVYIIKSINEHIEIPANKTLELNLNGNTVNGPTSQTIETILNNGNLTVTNGVIHNTNRNAIKCNQNATLELSLVEVKSDNYGAIDNSGVSTINKNAIISNSVSNTGSDFKPYSVIFNNNNGVLTVNDGLIFSSGKGVGICNGSGSKTVISGGTIYSNQSNTINTYGEMIVRNQAKIFNVPNINYPCFVCQQGSTTTIEEGYIYSNYSYGLWLLNGSTTTISGGTIYSNTSYGIKADSGATDIINGGTIYSNSSNAINTSGELTINGETNIFSNSSNSPTFNCLSGSNTTINGGTIYNPSSYAIWNQNGSTTTISGGTVYSNNTIGIYNASGATATFEGGEIYSNSAYAVRNYGNITVREGANIYNTDQVTGNFPAFVCEDNSTTNIYGGNIYSTMSSALISRGTTTISGGNIHATSKYGINSSKGTLTISGGTINSTNEHGLYNASTATVNVIGGTISTNANNKYGLYNSGGTVTITGGTISSTYGV